MYGFEILHAEFATTSEDITDAFSNAFDFDVVGKITQELTQDYKGSWKKFLVEFKNTPECIDALFAPTVEFHSASAPYYKLYYNATDYWIAYLVTIPLDTPKSLSSIFLDAQQDELQRVADILFV
jgi:hypothetical protein